ncbi:MAG: DUF4335 domain-containing protein [Leptolyngbya sp. SIO1D8]|nr:DUF4335 domain-containing protein [Leptolyngbya sp. SIO1D8]
MTVQRQYTLPNCSLTVEGLSTGDGTDPTAPLTVVLNTECKFPGITDVLTGGREFLDALIKTVSIYTQSILSGIAYPSLETFTASDSVVLQPGDNHRHQLTAKLADVNGEAVLKTLNLSTVQLFDLVEAVDQLLADTQTLPDMTLQLSPLHRRHVRPAEPLTKRMIPVATGVSALAASAALLFVLPVPESREALQEEQESAALLEEGTNTGTANIDTPIGTSPIAETEDFSSTAEIETDSGLETEIGTVQSADPVSAAASLSRLETALEITDPDELARLEEDLEEALTAELPEEISFEESLVYRVAVSESGDLLGYKYENDAALENVDSTPLPELTFIPIDPAQAVEEPTAQFRITFDPDGEVMAEPIDPDKETEDSETSDSESEESENE